MQSKSHITVISEGRTFTGVRTPRAFTWIEATPTASAPRKPRSVAPTSNLVYVFSQLAKLKLATQDLAVRRQQAASLSTGELAQLAAVLRAATKAPAR